MRIVEVIPISRAIPRASLSYFTSKKISLGAVISVPLKNKKINGIVVGSEEVSFSKTELRLNKYQVKKVLEIKARKVFLPEFIEAGQSLANFFIASPGSVFYSLIPRIFLDDNKEILTKSAEQNNGDIHEKYVIGAHTEERYANYKSIIREQIAKKKSVIFLAPTSKLAEKSYEKIKKGIDSYCYIIHTSLKKRELSENLKKVIESKKPVIVVTTGKFLSLPLQNIGAIIVEKENSNFYKLQTRPFIDFRTFAEIFSKKLNAKLFIGDLYLRTETIWRVKEGEMVEFIPMKQKIIFKSTTETVDMKSKANTLKGFKIVGPVLHSLIKKSQEEEKKIFLFSARKGLHPFTVCGDCGQVALCDRCSSPLVLHNSGKKNFFLCHKCGRSRDAESRCRKCNSWKLIPLGIGIDLVYKKIKENFKNIKIFKIDGDSTPTPQKREEVYKEFSQEKTGVLLGTEMALSYLENVDYSGIVSLDSFFSIPDFRINEKIMNLVLSIREKTNEKFVLQTRNINQEVLNFISNVNLADFYREEIRQRKVFEFPPFFDFIKISFSGDKKALAKENQKIKEFFEDYDISIYPGFLSKLKGKIIMNALIKMPRGFWPDKVLKEKISTLPQKFRVDVNPDNLL